MNGSILGWAIAGTGGIARRFAADMRHARGGRIVAVASATPARAASLAAAIGPDVASGDLATVLRDPAVEAVYVAGRNETHHAQALACLAAGKPVLIEKPLATNVEEARNILDAAADAKLLAMEAMWMRFTPGMRRLKALVDAGEIGTVRGIEAGLSFRNAAPQSSALLDLGVYPLSLASQLLGSPQRVAAVGSRENAAVVLQYGRALASFRCGFAATGPNRLAIVGDRGTLLTDAPFICPSLLTLRRAASPPAQDDRSPTVGLPVVTRPPWLASARSLLRPLRARRLPILFAGSGLQYQADHFAECLAAGRLDSPVMPLAESVDVIRVAQTAEAVISASTVVVEG